MEGLRNRPRIVKVERVIQEAITTRTLLFHDDLALKGLPGQFYMIWLPGVDEVPMSVSCSDTDQAAITVRSSPGPAEKLYEIGVGGYIGIRGPYGRGFREIDKGSALLVGGSYGLAPMALLAMRLAKSLQVSAVLAGKSRDDLLFYDKIEKAVNEHGGRIVTATEDGSRGIKGSMEGVEMLLKEIRPDIIYAYGPESLLYRIFLLAEKKGIEVQMGVDRIMKCGFGICGSCCLGKYLTCVDGPVLHSKALKEVAKEFGSSYRDVAGRIVNMK